MISAGVDSSVLRPHAKLAALAGVALDALLRVLSGQLSNELAAHHVQNEKAHSIGPLIAVLTNVALADKRDPLL